MDNVENVPVVNGIKYRSVHDLGPEGSDKYDTRTRNREKVQRVVNNAKAYPRRKLSRGLRAFDTAKDMLANK